MPLWTYSNAHLCSQSSLEPKTKVERKSIVIHHVYVGYPTWIRNIAKLWWKPHLTEPIL